MSTMSVVAETVCLFARRFRLGVPPFGPLIGLILLLCLLDFAQAQASINLDDILRQLSQVNSMSATFVERRTVSTLDRPIESSGRLLFEAPDTFIRETTHPRRDRASISGSQMTLSMGGRTRMMSLDAVPEAALVMQAVRGVLTGSRTAIDRDFVVAVSGSGQDWVLDLVPIDLKLREKISSVRLAGRATSVREVTVTMGDGDRSVMSIEREATSPPIKNAALPASAPLKASGGP